MINQRLKFSWGHIVSFVALIFIAYATFVGMTYLTKGDFMLAGVVTAIIVVLIMTLFVAVQQLKGCDSKYTKKIRWERTLFWVSPVFFLVLMIPYFHTWKVQRNNDEIVEQFNEAINASRQMFLDYEKYASQRMNLFDFGMDSQIHGEKDSETYKKLGFSQGLEQMQKENRIAALKLQLISPDYDSLKLMANKWIDKANQGANVWNVFLLGNINEIQSAIKEWHGLLVSFSCHVSESELVLQQEIAPFDMSGESMRKAMEGLTSLKCIYTEKGWPSLWGCLTGILCYFLMLFPWLIQKRNSNNPYRLVGYQRWRRVGPNPIIDTGI